MDVKQTYDILKYGTMNPDKVRSIIDTYIKDSRDGYYTSGWIELPVKQTIESKYNETHFFKIWVYFDTKMEATIFAFIPRYLEDLPTANFWQQVGNGTVAVNVSNMDVDEVYINFHEWFEELNKICIAHEYKENWGDDE